MNRAILNNSYIYSNCKTCGNITIFRCTNCKITYYCTRQCQTQDWEKHEKECFIYVFNPMEKYISLKDRVQLYSYPRYKESDELIKLKHQRYECTRLLFTYNPKKLLSEQIFIKKFPGKKAKEITSLKIRDYILQFNFDDDNKRKLRIKIYCTTKFLYHCCIFPFLGKGSQCFGILSIDAMSALLTLKNIENLCEWIYRTNGPNVLFIKKATDKWLSEWKKYGDIKF